jgi:hypothetical protein
MSQSERSGRNEVKTPLTFKLMIGLTVLYLGWRFVQGVVWLVEWIF